ncbi:MAG: M15 family metallopeptidase [Pseudomonadota bacterium]
MTRRTFVETVFERTSVSMTPHFYDLKERHIGTDVMRLQSFLIAQGITVTGGADGVFGPKTRAGVDAFHTRHDRPQSGTFRAEDAQFATALGYENTCFETPHPATIPPAEDDPTYPPIPSDLPRPTHITSDALFGTFEFSFAPKHHDPQGIDILDTWVDDTIIRARIPQLVGMLNRQFANPPIMVTGEIVCHRLAAPRIQALFAAWDKAGLLDRVLYYTGCFYPRLKRGTTDPLRANLSNHAWGAAFDINSQENWLGQTPAPLGARGCVRELVHIANEEGFYWGGHFERKDGMHFEVAAL